MIRIDHAIGLMRSFWIPDGHDDGVYVTYPLHALLACLRMEAARSKAIIVAEDLGLVPDGLRAALSASGLYGCSVMQFEREHDHTHRRVENYPAKSLTSFATHDTPTVRGFWAGADLDARHRTAQLSGDALNHQHTTRREDCAALARTLGVDDSFEAAPDLCLSVHAALATTPADLIAVQLEDILDRVDQTNLPGTIDTYPNWRLKYDRDVDEIATDLRLQKTADIMKKADR